MDQVIVVQDREGNVIGCLKPGTLTLSQALVERVSVELSQRGTSSFVDGKMSLTVSLTPYMEEPVESERELIDIVDDMVAG